MEEKINNQTDILEDQFYKEINSEESSLWYKETIGLKQTTLVIKTITPCIKALVAGCSLKLVFGKKDNYLCIGTRIMDIPDATMFISKVQFKSEEHRALIYALQKGIFDISLINEMNKLVAWSKVAISKQKALNILKWMQTEESLYVGTHTNEVDYAHDCFCVSVESSYKREFPYAKTIPYIELETTIEDWNKIDLYSYSNNSVFKYSVEDKDEGGAFEEEIASALISVFPSTLYKNPKFKKGENEKELTDIFAFCEYANFLIEAKEISIIESNSYSGKIRRILKTRKKVKEAIKQMTGATKAIINETEIYSSNNEKININPLKQIHCIILITEFIYEGDWSEVEDLLFDAIDQTGAIFNIMDFREFIELLKASSGRPEIIDYNLRLRFEWVKDKHSICIRGK